jgi:hypothetical protein
MKFISKRDDVPEEVKSITIYIGLERYRITESVDGKMNINKMSDGDSDNIQVHPRYANEIELT